MSDHRDEDERSRADVPVWIVDDWFDLVHATNGAADLRQAFLARHKTYASILKRMVGDPSDYPSHGENRSWPDLGDRFEIRSVLGEGGMAVVYHAVQKFPVKRDVAIKVLRGSVSDEEARLRFRCEFQFLLSMTHPNVCLAFDTGETKDGREFLVMEYVDGRPIDQFCIEESLPYGARIRLMQAVCRGIQHAHQRGVVHRDLKPSNILVVGDRKNPQPKIIDFGIARVLEETYLTAPLMTETGRVLGTVEYMSPEQLRARPIDVDTRTDVYSIGVVLFELLSGRLPYPNIGQLSIADAQALLAAGDPPRPSSLDRGRGHRRKRSRVSRFPLKGDLDLIATKAMAFDPDRRYESPLELANDLERYVEGKPVAAARPTVGYRISRFVRRHRVLVGASMLALIGLCVGAVVGWIGYRRAVSAADRLVAMDGLLRSAEQQGAASLMIASLEDYLSVIDRFPPPWPEHSEQIAEFVEVDIGSALETARDLRSAAASSWSKNPLNSRVEERFRSLMLDRATRIESRIAQWGPWFRSTLDWSRAIRGWTLRHPNAPASWRDARKAILAADGVSASRRYGWRKIDLEPQWGLVPMGMNPRSGLWEFYHLRSACESIDEVPSLAVPRADDRAVAGTDESSGIVFVLVPGGSQRVGVQNEDPALPHYSPGVEAGGLYVEGSHGVDVIELEPFFIAKHELTVGQWRRLCRSDADTAPCYPAVGPGSAQERALWAYPVNCVRRAEAKALLKTQGLCLPTDAQWECAARGGTDSLWFCGDDPGSVLGYANLGGDDWRTDDGAADRDGVVGMAPVGTLLPNPFGLHNTIGNVWEWVEDQFGAALESPRAGDGLRTFLSASSERQDVFRGSTSDFGALAGASARRLSVREGFVAAGAGVRAARPVFASSRGR